MSKANMKTKIIWEPAEQMATVGEFGYVGRWRCFSCHQGLDRDPNGPWYLRGFLPGMKNVIGQYPTAKTAKAEAEKALVGWLDGLVV